jgi:catechol 2,3-dioxygenase-like lactoylglutathione lyase family enzyme
MLVGGGAMSLGAQSNRIAGNNGLNHVGITVSNMNEAIDYYSKNFGFEEAVVNRDDKGQPTMAYIHVSRNTFLELTPATAQRPAGIAHFGVHVDNIKAAIATLRQRGLTVPDPFAGRTISFLTNIKGPDGITLELSEIGPQTPLGQAIASWR